MRWALFGNVTPAAADALRRHEHQVVELADAPAEVDAWLAAAKKAQLDVMTADPAMASVPFAEGATPFNRTIVFLQLAGGDVEQDDAIDRLFTRYKRLAPGRLYTVTEKRVKIRQLPQPTLPGRAK